MSFTRTKSGINNLGLFYDAELVVFTEGGEKSYSYDDVKKGQYNKQSIDIKFWSNIFKKHKFNKKVEFRALGSKTSAEKICNMISDGEIKNTCVTRDSDLDDFFDKKFNSPYILYTRGYSWENDVFQPNLVKEQIKSMITTAEIPEQALNQIDEAFNQILSYSKRLLKVELIFRRNGVELITKCNGERFISKKSTPRLKMDQVKLLIKKNKHSLIRPASFQYTCSNLSAELSLYGKLLEALSISLIAHIYKKQTKSNSLQKDLIVLSMIERYKNHQEPDNYYRDLIEKLQIA